MGERGGFSGLERGGLQVGKQQMLMWYVEGLADETGMRVHGFQVVYGGGCGVCF